MPARRAAVNALQRSEIAAFISRILLTLNPGQLAISALDRHRLRMVTHANRGNRRFHRPTLLEADYRSCPHASTVSRIRSSSLLCNRAILHRPCVVGNPRLLEHVAECVARHRTKARLIFLLVPRSLGEKQLQFDLADYHSLTVGRSPNNVLSCPALIANRTGKRLWRVPGMRFTAKTLRQIPSDTNALFSTRPLGSVRCQYPSGSRAYCCPRQVTLSFMVSSARQRSEK